MSTSNEDSKAVESQSKEQTKQTKTPPAETRKEEPSWKALLLSMLDKDKNKKNSEK